MSLQPKCMENILLYNTRYSYLFIERLSGNLDELINYQDISFMKGITDKIKMSQHHETIVMPKFIYSILFTDDQSEKENIQKATGECMILHAVSFSKNFRNELHITD